MSEYFIGTVPLLLYKFSMISAYLTPAGIVYQETLE